MTQLDPPVPLETPAGDAMAYVLLDYGPEHHLRWVCFLAWSGECWTFDNTEVRLWSSITSGRTAITPFTEEAMRRFEPMRMANERPV